MNKKRPYKKNPKPEATPKKKRTKSDFAKIFNRPRKFDTIEQMQEAITEYFKDAEERGAPFTVQGLGFALGFKCRQSLQNYEGYTDENQKPFLDTIKKAKYFIENNKVEGAMNGKYNTAFTIFDLKNNHGHEDKVKNENETTLQSSNVSFVFEMPNDMPALPTSEKEVKDNES